MSLKGQTFFFGTELRKLRYSGESRVTVPLEIDAILSDVVCIKSILIQLIFDHQLSMVQKACPLSCPPQTT